VFIRSNKVLALGVLAVSCCWGLSNGVTVQEKSGSDQTNRVLTIPRYFADKEICQYPAPYTDGAAMAYWQADVKTRWPADAACAGGYARIVLVTVEIPSLAANSSMVIEFRNSTLASSTGTGLTKTQMLAFDAGAGASSWGAKLGRCSTRITIRCSNPARCALRCWCVRDRTR
jgi:hypothetical protein